MARHRSTGSVAALPGLLGLLAVLLLAQLAGASPASAHAELVTSTPANGSRLTAAPEQVTLEFTESVGLVDGGLRLLDADGRLVETAEPTVEGATVRWPMPAKLPTGRYLVDWRVVSQDSHPVAGAFSFGVGVAPDPVAETSAALDLSWPATAARFAGYLGYALAAGAVALVLFCWRQGRSHPVARVMLLGGLVLAGVAGVVALFVQGPYVADEPVSRLLDRTYLASTLRSDFGLWTQARVYLCLALAAVLWSVAALEDRINRWVAVVGVLALTVTFTATGHAASGDPSERVVDGVHLLAAGVWVGGLALLGIASAVRRAGERPGLPAVAAFSPMALGAVVALVLTGTVNALVRLDTPGDLPGSGYGQALLVKLGVVAVAVAVAAASRRRLREGAAPWGTVRVEAVGTVVVVAVTALLASIAPPAGLVETPAAAGADVRASPTSVEMPLRDGNRALLVADTSGRSTALRVAILHPDGRPRRARRVELSASLDARDLGPIAVPLRRAGGGWSGRFDAPLPGRWTVTLTVENADRTAEVTSGDLPLR